MQGLTAADFADTGQWRLIVNIHQEGMDAWLKNTLRADVDPQLLFKTEWSKNEEELLHNIENAVFDHPRVLEDFAAQIILFDNKTLFIPRVVADENDGGEEELYTEVYSGDPSNVMSERDGSVVSAFRMVSGLKSFLYRTFPGAKITSNLTERVRELRKKGRGIRTVAEVREKESDIMLFRDDELISASTRDRTTPEDIVYYIFNLFDIYNIDPRTAEVKIKGVVLPEEIKNFLREKTLFTG